MTKSNSRALLGGVLFLVFVCLNGQQGSIRSFDEEQMQSYAEQSAFDYMNYSVKPPSIWERLSWWFQSMLEKLFLNPNAPWLTRIAYYVIFLVVIGAVIYYLVRLRYGGGLISEGHSKSTVMEAIEQTSAENFDELINGAVKEGNYKLAIRYVYLKSLSSLAKRGIINLKDWKSPYDYAQELSGEMAGSYQEMARLFEYVWYGDFEAGEKEFQKGNNLSEKLEKAV